MGHIRKQHTLIVPHSIGWNSVIWPHLPTRETGTCNYLCTLTQAPLASSTQISPMQKKGNQSWWCTHHELQL